MFGGGEACYNNCGTFNHTYICININGCEDLGNPRQYVTFGANTTLSNIPCQFTGAITTNCSNVKGMNLKKSFFVGGLQKAYKGNNRGVDAFL